ncbi:ABC transporter permease subunit [Legionella oakridgensis]|uniref:ABC-type spermidine/putrescine transport system, permease component II n=2 Tax=Legionella oakridgensis TaxID=29423 RepID=W0B8E1_9GAMM|nr:ABC transporter permease subunit [Legionella oakridgensis]AHE66783.1 ABC-type spermidine/putrescine transport system, permease component II [Legionella oakridgensis ATCC 33761 = DSM 21215]ETO93499.1 ABC-type spermidine/putrescine transport system, permease component II [Legionella oakridgensis RV-2-2007]KTD39817.1 spermidine/putrescine transport system permease potC [Legionella oakridgensis]STY19903.1 spermidine/putrescine transport system permease potC [Legionella longbeachae]
MKTLLQKSYLSLIYVFLYFPILILILYSVNQARFSLQWHGFSTHWYMELFHDRELWSAFLHSVILGLSASIIATLVGLFTCVHFFLHRNNRRRRSLFAMLLLLVIIPDLVLGVALLIFFNLISLSLGFFSLLIAHITFCIPFVVLTINSRIHTLDANIYYSALDLGASHTRALVKILLPLLWPAVLSALLLCFTLSFDDVIISYFVAGPDFNILPLTIYSLVRVGVTPELNALCSITFFISMILVIIAHRLARKSA